jgi:CrcB protein
VFQNVLLIALGGGIGSVARYFVQKWIFTSFPHPFPFGTFIVNIAGCFLIGLFYALSEKGNLLSPGMRLLLTTGLCGGFTTFSTFAYENFNLLKTGDFIYTILYAAGSVILGLVAVYLGILIIKIL